jgi:hypothetical protein
MGEPYCGGGGGAAVPPAGNGVPHFAQKPPVPFAPQLVQNGMEITPFGFL